MRLLLGDCVEVMAGLESASVDSFVTDPPYGLEFMGKEWDGADGFRRSLNSADVGRDDVFGRSSARGPEYRSGHLFQEWSESWATEALRVLKPGGHLVAFGGTRTFHRLACGLEDAGFEIRDTLAWMYGSGFPKSLDVSKAIDKQAGAERETLSEGSPVKRMIPGADQDAAGSWIKDNGREFVPTVTAPATPEAEQWQGWGTALKPAFEPIVLARKPLTGTVAANVLAHGTGGLNIDGCRVEYEAGEVDFDRKQRQQESAGSIDGAFGAASLIGTEIQTYKESGRWPANVLLDEHAAAILDEQSGESTSSGGQASLGAFRNGDIYGKGRDEREKRDPGLGDTGGASRFFYTAKTSSEERHAELTTPSLFSPDDAPDRNHHPTVKPVDLMRWLCRLITPPGGIILDPFMGSGTTGIAAHLEGFDFIGIERDADYMKIAEARIAHWTMNL